MKKAEDEKETKHSRNSFMKKEKALRLRCRERDHMSPESEGESRSLVSDSLPPHELYSPWSSPGQNTGVGSLSLLQGIFPTQVSHIAGGFFTSWATREAQEWTQRGWQKGELKKSYLKDSDLTAKEMKDN